MEAMATKQPLLDKKKVQQEKKVYWTFRRAQDIARADAEEFVEKLRTSGCLEA